MRIRIERAYLASIAIVVMPAFVISDAIAVYRCSIGGTTTYSDTPCPKDSAGGRVRLYSGGPSEEDAARAQERLDKMRADTIELRERQEAERAADAEDKISQHKAEKDAKRKACDELRAKRNDADYWAAKFRYRENIEREQKKAAAARDRLWWDCQNID